MNTRADGFGSVGACRKRGIEHPPLRVAEFAVTKDRLIDHFFEEQSWELGALASAHGGESGFQRGIGGDGVEVCGTVFARGDGCVGVACGFESGWVDFSAVFAGGVDAEAVCGGEEHVWDPAEGGFVVGEEVDEGEFDASALVGC